MSSRAAPSSSARRPASSIWIATAVSSAAPCRDSFSYQVRDTSGLLSNEGAVSVTVTAVAQVPLLSVSPAGGDQDTRVPLTISASLPHPDPNNTLYIDVSALPPGATLSAGTIVA